MLRDLQSLFPAAEQSSLTSVVDRIRDSSTTIGVVAALGAIWIGASFWGAMDTAFCRIYHVECRGWVEQKRFALVMLVGRDRCSSPPASSSRSPRGCSPRAPTTCRSVSIRSGALRAPRRPRGGAAITFAVCSLIYYFVPKGHVPWPGVWPGALFVTLTTAIANGAFPFYLAQSRTSISSAARSASSSSRWSGSTSSASRCWPGAVINALRYELHDTGSVEEERARAFAEDLEAQG